MAFLKRVSDSFWSYISPTKKQTPPTPQTLPKSQRDVRNTSAGSIDDVAKRSRSMSADERIEHWRLRSASQASSSASKNKKRKRLITPKSGRGPGRPRKSVRMEDYDMDYAPEIGYDDDDVIMDEDEEGVNAIVEDEDEFDDDNIDVGRSKSPSRSLSQSASPKQYHHGYDSTEFDSSLLVDESEYPEPSPKPKVVISPTEEHFLRGVSTEELRAQGWNDEHITLVQKIAMRGYEPLMPLYWKFPHRFHLPDDLFAADDIDPNIVISSIRGDHYRGEMALQNLFKLGGLVRDRVYLKGKKRPEQQVRTMLNDYIKWANEDSGLDSQTAIPLLTIETQPKHVSAEKMKQNAMRKLVRLEARYRAAFRVFESVESSPVSRTSTNYSYPIPTFYAVVASETLIAITAYDPDAAEPDLKTVSIHDMKSKDYDVWNALALAILVCHLRNVQISIADDTGLGKKSATPRKRKAKVDDDPDA